MLFPNPCRGKAGEMSFLDLCLHFRQKNRKAAFESGLEMSARVYPALLPVPGEHPQWRSTLDPLWSSQCSVCHQDFSFLCSSRAEKGFFCCKPGHSTHGTLQTCCSACISLQISQRSYRPCSPSPFLQEEMVQATSLSIKFHSKRQKGAEQIFPLQEVKPTAERDKHLFALLVLTSTACRAQGRSWVENWGESDVRLLIQSSTGLGRNRCPCYSNLGKVATNGY